MSRRVWLSANRRSYEAKLFSLSAVISLPKFRTLKGNLDLSYYLAGKRDDIMRLCLKILFTMALNDTELYSRMRNWILEHRFGQYFII